MPKLNGSKEELKRFLLPRRTMHPLRFLLRMILPMKGSRSVDEEAELPRYRKIWWYAAGLTLIVSLTPLVIMTELNHYMYRGALESETRFGIARALSNVSRSLEFVVEERLSALELLIQEKSPDELNSDEKLAVLLANLERSFGGFVDLGVIDRDGVQTHYAGPYDLQGDRYDDQKWFQEVAARGLYVSEVFMGHRRLPHFIIAVRRGVDRQSFLVLRATVAMELLTSLVFIPDLGPSDDVFIVSRDGVLQTPSLHHGGLLEPCPISLPPVSMEAELIEDYQEEGKKFVLGHRSIAKTPFTLMVLKSRLIGAGPYQKTRDEMLALLVISTFFIILVVLWSSTYLVRQIRAADIRRAEMLHKMEFTSKMATIGRLAASVAHEINNPLAIINEKAGLLQDLMQQSEQVPYRDRILKNLHSITNSVERCGSVTHRLLGFTRTMESQSESIDLADLLQEVLRFTGNEALHRNITVATRYEPGTPPIHTDRGQLQQIFLNIINNSFAAVPDGGRVDLVVESPRPERVAVTIRDNGSGIPEDKLPYIFEPFFSMKGKFGTGLGLSITYDLVQRMGAHINISSKLGEGTAVTVEFPASSDTRGAA